MPDLSQLPPFDEKQRLQVVIDTPKGSRAKYKYDRDNHLFRLSKILPMGAVFPGNFGFIPGTRGEDGDELDVLVLGDEGLAQGCVATVRLIGVIKAEQSEAGQAVRNDRLLAVIETDYNPALVRNLEALNAHQLDELAHFFVAYNQMQGRMFRPLGREGPDAALKVIESHRITS